jgi:hypothetical protein
MIRIRYKKVLLVAPNVYPDRLLADCRVVKHISAVAHIFPSLFELNPDMIIFDYDYVGEDIEKVLRRIRINKFYSKLKVCCYKNHPNIKTDGLLKALGVNYLFYPEDYADTEKSKTALNNIGSIFDSSILKWVAGVSH